MSKIPLLFIECPKCGASGFSGRGTGYDDVCSECGGQRLVPLSSYTEDYKTGHFNGAATERAEIVAWLDKRSESYRYHQYDQQGREKSNFLTSYARAIERGEHKPPKTDEPR